jgi:hypothetical protein
MSLCIPSLCKGNHKLTNIFINSLWQSSYYDSYWFTFLGASQNSCDELFWWAPTPISSIPPYIIPRLHKLFKRCEMNVKNSSKHGMGNGERDFHPTCKNINNASSTFWFVGGHCGSCSLCTSECWVPMKIGCPLRRSSLEAS